MIKLFKKNSLKYIIIIIEFLFMKYFISINSNSFMISHNDLRNNISKINNIKRSLHDKIYKIIKKNISYINTLYIKGRLRFGNYFISLNNAILFCEFLNCKKIIIQNEFINHKIYYQKYNLTIESNNISNSNNNDSIIINNIYLFFKYFNFTNLGEVNRFDVFRKEILNNLPKVKINLDEVYIYIRGGDVFRHLNRSSNILYIQPPLCFYKSILNQFNFRKFAIISEDKANPIMEILLKEYPYIKYNKNNIKLDISYLVNSYNIVSAASSFVVSIIKLNKNLKFLWEYDFYILLQRYLHLHHSVYSFSFSYTIYKMNSSKNYKKLMFPFHNSEKQRNLMIEEKCDNYFQLFLPRIS